MALPSMCAVSGLGMHFGPDVLRFGLDILHFRVGILRLEPAILRFEPTRASKLGFLGQKHDRPSALEAAFAHNSRTRIRARLRQVHPPSGPFLTTTFAATFVGARSDCGYTAFVAKTGLCFKKCVLSKKTGGRWRLLRALAILCKDLKGNR